MASPDSTLIKASSTSTSTPPEIGRSLAGTSTEYVYVLPATIGHPGVMLAQPSAMVVGGISATISPM